MYLVLSVDDICRDNGMVHETEYCVYLWSRKHDDSGEMSGGDFPDEDIDKLGEERRKQRGFE